MKINILPASVYNRIAAGEVVDRPYSVVKELVENSIDAGAKNIDIAIIQGGKKSIRVSDDGCGIEREDLQSAFLPHATSKIKNAEDLDTIMTLGFRGEALASIASVAEVTILSKTDEGNAYRITNFGGTLGEIIEAGGGKGTEVSVENLFFNTPARQKFLKTDKGEEADVTNLISRLVLGHPEISFTYYADGKKVCQSFGGGLEEAMAAVYEAKILKDCIRVNAEKHGIKITGYIGNQNYFKANRSYQSTFINGRYVTNNTLQMAMHNAYASYMMKRQYPFYVLFLTVPPEIVDVNVHPNKADVRFANNQIIYGTVYSVISSVLDGSASALDYVVEPTIKSTYAEAPKEIVTPKVEQTKIEFNVEPRSTKPMSDKVKVEPAYKDTFTIEDARKELELTKPKINIPLPFENVKRENVISVQSPRANYAPIVEEKREEKKEDMQVDFFEENKKYLAELEAKKAKQAKIEVEECIFRGKLFQTYLIYERGNDAYLIDQHAAHERLIYNKLKEEMANRTVVVQPMLLPYLLTVNTFESEFLLANLEHIRSLGFDMDEFGSGTFKVSGVPMDLQSINLDDFFGDILSDISGLKGIKLADLLQDKLAMAACKAAVKGGMNLSDQEVKELFRMMDGDMGLKCPHGRPVVVRLTKSEIEKMFKRIV